MGGSDSKTSIPAPPRCPLRNAAFDRSLVDDAAAGDVEEDRAGLHPGELRRADEAAGRPRQRDVDRDDVRLAEQVVERDQLDAVMRGLLGGHERIGGEDGHLHRPRPGGDRLADLAEPDDPERPAAQLEARELGPLPLAAPHRRVGRGDPTGDAVEEGERVLGGRDRVAGRGVDDRDARPASRPRGRRCRRRRRPGR